MGISRRNLMRLAGASLAAPALSRAGLAQAPQVTLKLHHAAPPMANIHVRVLTPWAKKIEEESHGALRIVIFPSMQLGGTPRDLYDQARDGVADLVWTAPGATPDRFPGIETFELPFVAGKRGRTNAKAAQDFYETHLRAEFGETRPIAVLARDGGVIHANRPVRSLGDVRGLRLRPPTRLAGEGLQAAGARPVAAPLSQVGESLANNALDGCIVSWEIAPSIRASELAKFHTGFGSPTFAAVTFVLAMNRAKYESLSADIKAVLDANGGRHFAALAGSMFDEQSAIAEEESGRRGHSVAEFSAHEVGLWRKATEPVIHAWLKRMQDRGLDGEMLLAEAKRAVAKYEGG
jgi:TRAP-type C4-dicarboxylate transport system substrate-binding protein